MDLNFSSRKKLANVLANKAGLNLVEEAISQPRTDGRTIYVPYYDPRWNYHSEEAIDWWHSFYHEILHNVYSDDFDVIKREKLNMRSKRGFIHNILVDHSIEHKGLGMYPGMDDILLNGHAISFKKHILDRMDEVNVPDPALDAMILFDRHCRGQWNCYITDISDYLAKVSDDAVEKFNRLMKYEDEYLTHKNGEENYALTKKLWAELEVEEDPEQSAADSSSDGDSEESGEESEESSENVKKKGIIDYMDLLSHSHEENGTKQTGTTETDINYSSWDGYSQPWKSNGFVWGTVDEDRVDSAYFDEINKLNAGNQLANEIRKYLLVKTQSHTETGHRRGKLDSSKFWKVKAYGANSQAAQRIHKQKIKQHMLDTAVLLLVDQSGSMSGLRYIHAVKSAEILTDTLRQLNMPVEVQSFSDTYDDKAINYVHKKFTDRKSGTQVSKSMCSTTRFMFSNPDGDCILHAVGSLLARKEKRKILVVLSDGQPASYAGEGDIYGFTREVVKEIENNSPVDIYGIGIQSSAVKDYYKHSKVINASSSIETTLLELLKEHVLV